MACIRREDLKESGVWLKYGQNVINAARGIMPIAPTVNNTL